VNARQLHILQHALGLDQYGRGSAYRNHFCAGGDDEPVCRELVALGYMREHATTEHLPYFNCSVTDAGREAVQRESPEAPKPTPCPLPHVCPGCSLPFACGLAADDCADERNGADAGSTGSAADAGAASTLCAPCAEEARRERAEEAALDEWVYDAREHEAGQSPLMRARGIA
jgi:hypothetical protein